MSTKATSPNKPRRLRVSDVRRELQSLLLGAEMAHKADINTYSCGHLSPYALSQTQPHRRRTEEPIWEMSEVQDREKDEEEGLSLNIEKMKEAMFDFTVAKGLKPKVLKPGQHESRTGTQRGTKGEEGEERERRRKTRPKMVLDTSELFLVKPSVASQTRPPGCVEERNQDRYWFTQSHLGGLTKKDQMRMMKHFDRQVLGKQDLRDRNWIRGNKAAEVYEWKLEKELRRLSDQSWPSRELRRLSDQSCPSRDRLGVFSDVFNDVCEGSPVFRDILREIKTDYDLYLNSILDSQTSLQVLSELAPLGGLAILGAEDLEEAENEVSRLGEEAQRALEENDRVRNQFQSARDRVMGIPDDKGIRNEATLPGLMRPGEGAVSFIDRVQPKRRQVWMMWEEVQLLQKELKQKMVSIITTGATERCIRHSKGEIMRLLASNKRFKNTNKDLESNINVILTRVRASEAVKAFSSGMSASLVRKLTREEDAPPAVKTTVVAGGPVVDDTPAAEAVAEALLADDPVADTAVVYKAVAEEPVEDTPVADAPVADAPVDTPVMAEEENEALITEEIIKELSAQEEDSGWGLASIRESLQAANGYFDSLVELMGGRNGVCQYKCKYGKTPVRRYGYVTPEPKGCSSNLLGFQFDIGIPAMTQCCNQLDSCYNTCGSNKYLCDSKYRWCLHAICSDLKKSLGFVSKVKACETVADGLYNTVWTLGCRSFMNSQREACYCDGEERDEL